MSVEELIDAFASSVSLEDDKNVNDVEPCKKWIKNIDLSKEIMLKDFVLEGYFVKVAKIEADNELNKQGKKMRKTVIRFISCIDNNEWKEENEWVYLLTINGLIVKIGGTRKGLQGRVSSYLCGHHVAERGKSGKCSVTNGYVYNTLDFYVRQGYSIDVYAFKIPPQELEVSIFGTPIKVRAQVYHAYESRCLEEYKKQVGRYPILSDNADPQYKD
jgi:hypothetical protein